MALEWVSTASAAAALGISERTVLRRAAAGKLESRKETTPRGIAVFVALESPDVPTGADVVRTGADTQATLKTTAIAVEVPTGADGADKGADTNLLAHLAEENRFLRATIEQHQRSEAELRASLREALRAMPKQLGQGDAPQSTPKAEPTPRQPEKVPEPVPQSEVGAVSYGDIADWLEKVTL